MFLRTHFFFFREGTPFRALSSPPTSTSPQCLKDDLRCHQLRARANSCAHCAGTPIFGSCGGRRRPLSGCQPGHTAQTSSAWDPGACKRPCVTWWMRQSYAHVTCTASACHPILAAATSSPAQFLKRFLRFVQYSVKYPPERFCFREKLCVRRVPSVHHGGHELLRHDFRLPERRRPHGRYTLPCSCSSYSPAW